MPDRPVRIQLRRTKGFNLQAVSLALNGLPAVNVARPGRFGNRYVAMPCFDHGGFPALDLPPFKAATTTDAIAEGRRIAVALHRHDWKVALAGPGRSAARAALDELRGRNLACWCGVGELCHGDDLLDLANGEGA